MGDMMTSLRFFSCVYSQICESPRLQASGADHRNQEEYRSDDSRSMMWTLEMRSAKRCEKGRKYYRGRISCVILDGILLHTATVTGESSSTLVLHWPMANVN